MTDNQEKQLFSTLATLVTGVQVIQSDVLEIKETLNGHSQILNNHSETLDKHSQILNKHSKILDRHLQILTRLDAKTDSIAQAVINQDKRLSKAEKNIEELQSEVH